MRTRIFKETGWTLLSLLIVGFLGWFFFWQPQPMTYDEAYKEAPEKIREYCKSINIKPCDYKFVKFAGNREGGTWLFHFESKHRPPIVVEFFSNGEANVYDSYFINQSLVH